jgi:hypothetical protein
VWCGVVWCGVVWCGVVWCGVVWCGVVWCGVVWYSTAQHSTAQHSTAQHSTLPCIWESQITLPNREIIKEGERVKELLIICQVKGETENENIVIAWPAEFQYPNLAT